jgi:hypothetical protein
MALRIGGQTVDKPSEQVLVLPRANGDDIIITARAVLSMEDFDRYVPAPQAKRAWVKGKGNILMTEDPGFLKEMETYGEKRFAFMAIKALEPSEIEWEKTKLEDPSTWTGWTEELKEAGLSDVEVQRIVVCVMQANSLDEKKLTEARAAFLRGLEEPLEKSSGPSTGPSSTPSGPAASDGE